MTTGECETTWTARLAALKWHKTSDGLPKRRGRVIIGWEPRPDRRGCDEAMWDGEAFRSLDPNWSWLELSPDYWAYPWTYREMRI